MASDLWPPASYKMTFGDQSSQLILCLDRMYIFLNLDCPASAGQLSDLGWTVQISENENSLATKKLHYRDLSPLSSPSNAAQNIYSFQFPKSVTRNPWKTLMKRRTISNSFKRKICHLWFPNHRRKICHSQLWRVNGQIKEQRAICPHICPV